MAHETFRRFCPGTDDYQDYINQARTITEQDIRTVSVLTGIFNPLVAEAVAKVPEPSSLLLPASYPQLKRHIHMKSKMAPLSHATSIVDMQHIGSFTQYFKLPLPGLRGVDELVVPIGKYGKNFSRAVIQAGHALDQALGAAIKTESDRVTRNFNSLLSRETYQKDAYLTLREGIQTSAAMIGALTAEEVANEQDPMHALNRLTSSSVLSELALISGIGLLFPMVLDGVYFKDLIREEEGKIVLSPHIREALLENGNRKKGCPAAYKTISQSTDSSRAKLSGIDLLTRKHAEYIAYFYSHSQ